MFAFLFIIMLNVLGQNKSTIQYNTKQHNYFKINLKNRNEHYKPIFATLFKRLIMYS